MSSLMPTSAPRRARGAGRGPFRASPPLGTTAEYHVSISLHEVEGSVEMRLKHFNADMTG